MIDVGDILRTALNSHFAAGVAGGFVRSFHVKEAFGIAAMRALAGGVSAHFITPIIIWAAPRFIDITQSDISTFNGPAGAAISFLVGLMGIMLSTVIEKVIMERFKK